MFKAKGFSISFKQDPTAVYAAISLVPSDIKADSHEKLFKVDEAPW